MPSCADSRTSSRPQTPMTLPDDVVLLAEIWGLAALGSIVAIAMIIHGEKRLMTSTPDEEECFPDPPYRPDTGTCPYCRAGDDEWCYDECEAIDPLDWRG